MEKEKPWPDTVEGARLILEAAHALLTGPGAACFLQQGVTGQVRLDAAGLVDTAETIAAACMSRSAARTQKGGIHG